MKKLNLSWLKDYIISYFSGIYTAIVVVLSMKDGQINNWSLFIFGLFWFIVGGVLLAFLFHRNKELLPQTEQEKSEKKDNDFNIYCKNNLRQPSIYFYNTTKRNRFT